MYVASVIPITRGVGKEELSYLVPKPVAVGELLHVPVRNKVVPAIVVSVREGAHMKAELKQARFRLKLVRTPKTRPFYDPRFLEAAQIIAQRFVGTTGEVLALLTPAAILRDAREGKGASAQTRPRNDRARVFLPSTLQAPLAERLALYKNTIRETFAHGQSVYVCVQTLGDIERIAPTLSRGLEPYVITLHGALSDKEQRARWYSACALAHPVLVIGTPHFLSLPRCDFGAYIHEGGEWRGRKSRERPYLDHGIALMTIARAMGAELIIGDTMLSLATQYAIAQGELVAHAGSRQRIDLSVEPTIIAIGKKNGSTKGSFEDRLLSPQLIDALTKNGKTGKHSFLFANRRGIAPVTICGDCGTLVTCPTCKGPRLLRGDGDKKHIFFCARCNVITTTEVVCSQCESWKLVPLGIGAERVFESVQTRFPDRFVVLMTSDTIHSAKEAEKMREQFFAKQDAILIGTEMALYSLREPVPLVAAVSLDALFAIPDYRMHERMYGLVVTLAEHASEQCLIQTRRPEEKLWDEIRELRSTTLYRSELRERETYAYPPVTVLIKIRWSGHREKRALAETYLEKILAPFEPTLIDGESARGEAKLIALLRVPRAAWSFTSVPLKKSIDDKDYTTLSALLSSLPRDFTVDVNPEDLLA